MRRPSGAFRRAAYASTLRASWPCLSASLALASSASAPSALSPMAICSSSLETASAMRVRRGPKTFLVSSAACFCRWEEGESAMPCPMWMGEMEVKRG